MQFPVSVGRKVRLVKAGFATQADVEAIQQWLQVPSPGDIMPVFDAAEYAGLACEKWAASRERGRVISRFGEIASALKAQPKAELVFLLVARAEWHEPTKHMGFCLFRRTWAHNLFVDYLGTDPRAFRPGARPASGIGTGLLYTVMALGQKIRTGRCMLEATDESFRFYRKRFRLMEINDMFALSPTEQWHYMETTRETWSRSGAAREMKLDPKTL